MAQHKVTTVQGTENDKRLESRILEERIQAAVADGARNLEVRACGQHGIGGRLFISEKEPVTVTITGNPGQRVGSMGFPGTRIIVEGPASDDVGWLNAGAEIVVRGNASNGVCNAMAQGKVFVGGRIGSRGMTMTKYNPRFTSPELWVLSSVGDYFAEFMAGGVAVVCGHEPQDHGNVLGYRPCVGMVGGRIYFRGPHKGFSQADAKESPIDDAKWEWLSGNIREFLQKIDRLDLLKTLTLREEWQLIEARTPHEKAGRKRLSLKTFRRDVWDRELGPGGLIGDLTNVDRSPIPLIPTGELRRFVPVWENRKFIPPCQSSCPTGIPVQQRWSLIREGKMDEAVDLALAYTPFPASVCGYLCPNLCMQGCTKTLANLKPVDITALGRKSITAKMPELPPLSGRRVAVVGGGPGGLSVAWQLRLKGHEAVIFDYGKTLGGKIVSSIPSSRIPKEVVGAELARLHDVLPHIHLQQKLTRDEFEQMVTDYDFVIIATGANKPRTLPIPGGERIIPALDFLKSGKTGKVSVGARVVIIGAGNVGCDVATEAHRLGARDITLIDIQKPASFGKEREEAERVGARFRFPCFTREITEEGVVLTSGEVLPADTIIVSIGDQPELDFLPDNIATERGFVLTNRYHQTTDARVFAIGDVVKLGLLTDAIGAGRETAATIDEMLRGLRPKGDTSLMVDPTGGELSETIDYSRMTLEYFDPRIAEYTGVEHCASECASCGACRDCGTCAEICPQDAISRKDLGGKQFEYVVNPNRCIACGFCAQSCPCGIWALHENSPLT